MATNLFEASGIDHSPKGFGGKTLWWFCVDLDHRVILSLRRSLGREIRGYWIRRSKTWKRREKIRRVCREGKRMGLIIPRREYWRVKEAGLALILYIIFSFLID